MGTHCAKPVTRDQQWRRLTQHQWGHWSNIYTSVRPNTWAPELSPTDPSTEPPQLHQPKERTTARQDWMVEGEWESHEKLTSPHCEQQSGDDTPPPTSAPRPSAGCWGATARPRHRKVSPTAPAAKCTEPDREAGEGERGAKEAGAAHSGESRAQVGDQDAGGRPGHQRLQRRVRPDGGHSSTPGKLCLPAPVPGSSTRARPGRSGHCGSGTPGRHAKQPAAQPHGRPHPAPLGVSQNLVANPVSNLVLPEAQRVRLTEPFRGCPSGPHPSAGAGPAGTTKVPMSTEHPQPTQDLEPLGVTFVGVPLHTSTPMETKGAAGPGTAFSFSTSDARAQPGAPQGQAVPAPAPVAPTAAPQATTDYASPGTTHVAQCPPPSPTRAHHPPTQPSSTPHSPPRNPHSPPRTSSSPASVNDPRGPRGTETSRKSMVELERKLAHRKISKFPDSPRESRQLAWERLVGEIAFQLDRRILSSIFPERVRLYGFTVSNIPEKIIQASLNPSDHKLDEELCQTLTQRYVGIMNRLQSLGYDGRVHPALTEQLVNAYGILRERPELAASEGGSYTVDFLQRVLVETVHPSMLTDALLLLSCLNQLAHDDGKPMFIW
ncbi:speriolin isoform X3 [Acinonyx jubatus]|uniref:Speriolin isoform X3 n=1 Tax=Acinonyx jubatus TaxID=32536 RepID=A0ABM3NX70_ACIJB|nr:speriolin isoform X3 [Acinonyx jubatus]